MQTSFEQDEHPGQPRILFFGLGHSSHTHAWIDLLRETALNVRLFCMTKESPPAHWQTKSYVWTDAAGGGDSATRSHLWNHAATGYRIRRRAARATGRDFDETWPVNDWLLNVVREWKPHIVHTLGIDAAHFYLPVREKLGTPAPRWVLQTRGGSDLQLAHADPNKRPGIAGVLRACDQLLSDNIVNYRIARDLGVREDQLARIGTVPGTGGVEIDDNWSTRPSIRRSIVWPKAFESPWSKSLPVVEALKICWERIQPCQIEMLATCPETLMHFWTLPEGLRQNVRVRERIPREEAVELIKAARVVLAPSLVDGVPNVMYEAMAAGAVPIVSPLESITPVVAPEGNVLFARNLYPEEIAAALERAMADDTLVDSMAAKNLELVKRIADREVIRPRVIDFYRGLAAHAS
jgi:glycosyltransferase involved in cell wall biosynthesis